MAVGIAGDENVDGAYYVNNGIQYYYVETTGSGWRIGEVLSNPVNGTRARLETVNSSPSLAFSWRSETVSGGVTITADVMNLGDAAPQSAELLIDVQNQNKETIQRNRTSIPSIPPDSTHTASIRTWSRRTGESAYARGSSPKDHP